MLRELNWAAGLEFEGAPPPRTSREYRAGIAVYHAWWLDLALTREKNQARAAAHWLKHAVPPDIAALVRQVEADAPALVYLVTHTALGAAKIGVTDAAGSRIAQHRRAGWQLLAAFQVSAEMACVIEDDVLRWWRNELGLPPHLPAQPDAPGRMDGDRRRVPRRPGGNGDAHLQPGGTAGCPPGREGQSGRCLSWEG